LVAGCSALVGVAASIAEGPEWVSHGPGGTGRITTIAIDPKASGTAYAGVLDQRSTAGVAYKSTDGGTSWRPLPLPVTGGLNGLVLDPATPTTLYVGTVLGGVLKSTDAGATWHAMNAGLGDASGPGTVLPVAIADLAIDPGRVAMLFVARMLG